MEESSLRRTWQNFLHNMFCFSGSKRFATLQQSVQNIDVFEKLMVGKLVKKFANSYGIPLLVAGLKSDYHLKPHE
jgi:phosphopantetheine adenylyltransferase